MMPLNWSASPSGMTTGIAGAPRRSRIVLVAELVVRPDLVHLVDEADARDVVLGRLAPDGFRLGLDAFLAVEHGDRAVEHAQGALDLGGEVHVAGGVDQVDVVELAVAVPLAERGGGVDRDAALLLFGVEVHDGGAFVHLADLVDRPV